MSSSCVYCSFLPSFLPSMSFFLVPSHLLTGNPGSPVCFSACCVSRRLHGGQTSWWSMQRTSWPFTPSTWMPLWRSNPLRAGTASPSSNCSMTFSGQTVSSCPNIHFKNIFLATSGVSCSYKDTNAFLSLPLFPRSFSRSPVQWKVPQTPSGSVCSSGG